MKSMSARVVPIVALATIWSVPFGAVTGAQEAGCGPFGQVIAERTDYARIEGQFGSVMEPPIKDGASESIADAKSRGFLALTPTEKMERTEEYRRSYGTELVTYLSRQPLQSDTTYVDLISNGDLLYTETSSSPDDPLLKGVQFNLGGRAQSIMIGPYEGLIIHGDEIASGVRPYAMWFSDGERDFAFRAGFSDPINLVELARSMVCD